RLPLFCHQIFTEQIQLILNSATLSPPNKWVMISYTDEEDEDEYDSTSGITSSNSLASSNILKKQTTLSKYVGRSLTASEISKFECLKELLIDEEFEEEQDDLDIADIDFLDSETHFAENQAAKWKLHDLFLLNLRFPFE
ncbi:15550_t:CDS:2, partial [Dentiscutata heterogama]